jgi:DNA-binding GntR family transcriptional regulator
MVFPSLDVATFNPASFRTPTAAEQIAEYLSREMVAGTLKQGEPIIEQKIAAMFGTSRGPVRDALRILEKQGMVKIEPRRGASVAEVSLNDVIDLFNARTALLCLAVRYLAVAQDLQRIEQMDVKLAEFENSVNDISVSAEDFTRCLSKLGFVMLHATPSQPLIDAFNSLSHAAVWRQVWRDHAFMYETLEGRKRVVDAYRPVFDAIREANPHEASNAMEQFAALVRDNIVDRIRTQRNETIDEFRLRCF